MTKEELRAQHPELYSAVFNDGKAEGEKGKAEAVSDALAKEKDRIEAHLVAGEQSGDWKTAHESIKSGAEMTQKLLTTYMMAGRNRTDREARSEDEATAAAAVGTPAGSAPTKTKAELVVESMERQLQGGEAA